METEVNDENMPTSSEQKNAKKNRRRSSIGSELMASFFKEVELERITTPEHVIRRNRRSAAVRADHRNKILSNNSQRLSIDVGEQPSMKSCLTQKSTSQRAAEKLLKKYRRSRSFSHTPHRPSLRFNSICTVRVITPRPQYDPDNLCLPSDDEDSKRSDRERLSTVKLDITPQSQAYLNTIKDKDNVNVEFHTQMIFGDGSKGEPVSNPASQPSDSKKRKRRKSLIVNAASPLRTPPPKPNFDEEEKTAKSCSRVLEVDEKKTRRRSGILKNVEVKKNDEVEKKKERRKSGVVQTVEEPKKITEEKVEKRGRRKSGLIAPEIENPAKRKSNFFAPRQLTVKEDEVKVIDPPPTKLSSGRRRSMRFVTEPVVVEPSTSSSSSSSQEVVEPIVASSPAAPPKKLFSLFSPRPSPKAAPPKEPEPELVEIKEEKPANISVSSTTSLSSTGIRKEKLWGDRIAATYCYLEMPPPREPEKDHLEQKNWLTKRMPACSNSETQNFRFRLKKYAEEKEEMIPPNSGNSEDVRDKDYGLDEYLEELKEFGAPSFKPQKFDELVEGSEDVDQVRGWLKKWKKRVRKEAKKQELAEKKKKGRKSKKATDSSDEEDSDYDASDDEELQNPLILKGPTGVGKSAFIATLAAEENMRIIGMGPDEERKGTSIKMKLTEAIRSHRVNTEPVGSLVRLFQTQKAVFTPKSNSQSENERKSIHDKGFQQSLVVFEHVDLLFGALDRNATTALIEMVNTSMVPIVWTCDEEYPMSTPMNELERAPMIISLRRKKSKVRKYCQSLVNLSTGVWINDEVMKVLASSMDYDMRGLINQAHFYALNDKIPLPLTDRFSTSNGFQSNWDIDKNDEIEHILSARKWDNIESKVHQYREIMSCVPDGFVKIDFPGAQVLVDDRELLKKKSDYRAHVESAADAFYGRYSRCSMNREMLPFLMEIDKREQEERAKSRRYQHIFTKSMQSEYPIDDDKLIKALAAIRSSFKFKNG